jgi:hypothetical protein
MALEFRDKLGGVILHPELIAKTAAYTPPELPPVPEVIEDPAPTGPWECIHQKLDSDQKTIHRVEQRGKEIRCTCKDFRLNKNANCEHIADARDLNKVK